MSSDTRQAAIAALDKLIQLIDDDDTIYYHDEIETLYVALGNHPSDEPLYYPPGAGGDDWMFAHAPPPAPLPPDPPDDWDEDNEEDHPHYDTPGGY